MLVTCLFVSAGPAGADVPGTTRTGDGDGVLVGSADAPVQLEIFCEPQWPVCARFEASSNTDISRVLDSGELAVTYRWLTVLDEKHHSDTSARVSTALMEAADPATPAPAYQDFVADLYRHLGSDGGGPAATDIAGMARESGVPEPVAARINAGVPVVDTAAMNTANRDRLKRVNPENPGTPTVYDLNANKLVDIEDAGWLDRLMQTD
jgi:hypothetical protein